MFSTNFVNGLFIYVIMANGGLVKNKAYAEFCGISVNK